MKTFVDKKQGTLSVLGQEDIVVTRREAAVGIETAKKAGDAAEHSLYDLLWEILRATGSGGIPGLLLNDFLGWKSSRIHIMGPGGEGGIRVTIPSPGAAGNFKNITDVGLFAQVSEVPEIAGLLATVEKEAGTTEPSVTLKGDLATWFVDAFVKTGKVPEAHPDMTVTEPKPPERMVTVSPKGFAQLVKLGADGSALARKVLEAGFKKWLVKDIS